MYVILRGNIYIQCEREKYSNSKLNEEIMLKVKYRRKLFDLHKEVIDIVKCNNEKNVDLNKDKGSKAIDTEEIIRNDSINLSKQIKNSDIKNIDNFNNFNKYDKNFWLISLINSNYFEINEMDKEILNSLISISYECIDEDSLVIKIIYIIFII